MVVTKLTRPLDRRIGNLIVRVSDRGVAIRGHRRRRWKFVTWEQVAAASSVEEQALCVLAEIAEGKRALSKMTLPRKKGAK